MTLYRVTLWPEIRLREEVVTDVTDTHFTKWNHVTGTLISFPLTGGAYAVRQTPQECVAWAREVFSSRYPDYDVIREHTDCLNAIETQLVGQ